MVINNTFSRNSHDGISITAVSQLFAAITLSEWGEWDDDLRHIRPEVRENVFEKRDLASILPKGCAGASWQSHYQEQSWHRRSSQCPTALRGNVIEGNTEDGVVAIATSQPDLGTRTETGGNVFRRNGRDINSSASNRYAFGNTIANARI